MEKEKSKKTILNEVVIMDIVLITLAIATVCCTIGLIGGFSYRNTVAVYMLSIGLAVLFTLRLLIKYTKIGEILAEAKPHKVIKWICCIISAIALLVLFVFIMACITLIIINGFILLYQAIF